jgi:hypothetical protein
MTFNTQIKSLGISEVWRKLTLIRNRVLDTEKKYKAFRIIALDIFSAVEYIEVYPPPSTRSIFYEGETPPTPTTNKKSQAVPVASNLRTDT